jgi:hypothetical protein
MFDAICFRDDATADHKIDFGFLAEALVFYGKAHFIGDAVSCRRLLEGVGAPELLELAKQGQLDIHLVQQHAAAQTDGLGSGLERYDVALIEPADWNPRKELKQAFLELAGGAKHSKMASDFMQHVNTVPRGHLRLPDIRTQIVDEPTFGAATIAWIRELAPECLPEKPEVRCWTLGQSFQVSSNVNLQCVSRALATKTGDDWEGFGFGSLLAYFISSHEDAYFAAKLSAEIGTTPLRAPMIRARFDHLWNQNQESRKSLSEFSEVTLGSARAIGDAIRQGRASFADLIRVLEERRKFREWLEGKPFDANLVAEYIIAVTRGSWLDKLPSKTVRWSVVSGLGLGSEIFAPSGIGSAVGLAISAFDAFLLEHLARGWRPNQFVDEQLKKLTNQAGARKP